MFPNRFALATLAAACIGAAGVGGFLATRQNVAGRATPDVAAASSVAQRPAQTAADAPPPSPLVKASPAAAPVVRPAERTPQPQPVPPRETVEAPIAPAPVSIEAVSAAAVQSELPTEHTPPSVAAPAPSPAASTTSPAPDALAAPMVRVEDHQVEPAHAAEPAGKTLEELTVNADSVIGLQIDTSLSSERSRIEDKVEAHVIRDVRAGGTVAIPAGTRALGTVVAVDRGGKFRERARLGIRFQTLILSDGTRLPITTETIYRFGDAPGNTSASRIGGGAVVGAIIGGIIGGGKGAAIGATTGAGAGAASVMNRDRDEAVFPSGAEVTARILSPVTVTVERN
jgi:hypothetical protein